MENLSEIRIIFILQSDDIFIHYAFGRESEGIMVDWTSNALR